MSSLSGIGTAPARSLRSRLASAPRERRQQRRRSDVKQLVGRNLAGGGRRKKLPIWLIPGVVVCGVIVALAIANLRVQLIGQGYKRASAVARHQELKEEQRNLAARVRQLRDPVRLVSLAEEMGFTRPEHAIAMAPPGFETRP